MTDSKKSIWQQAARLFDELAPLTVEQRRQCLERQDLSRPVRQWLEELLAAHDSDRTAIIDRGLDELVEHLLPPGQDFRVDATSLSGKYFGPWRVTGELGRGGMGVVLSGERADGQFEMRVAIKLLDPALFGAELAELFRREVRTLAELSHPGIAQLLDGGLTEAGCPYLVMEYIDGKPIDRYCREREPSLHERLALFQQIADVVDHCHRHMVIHGDIKPANVLVDGEGRVKLLDFGIAGKLVNNRPHRESGRRVRWCSPGFAAPERFTGCAPAVGEDVFALGALLYQMLTGAPIRSAPEMTRLLQGKTPTELPPEASRRALQQGLPEAMVRRIRGDLDAIIAHALAADADSRYRSVREFLDDLDRWRAGRPVSVRAASRAYRAACWLRRHSIAAVAGLMVVVSILAGSAIALWQADKASAQAQRAERNLAEVERTLQRVMALREFIVDLFASAEPDRPRDQLPSTREILRAGAARVREDDALAAGERFELAYTLGRIHDDLNLHEPAAELLKSAVALARTYEELGAGDLARALHRLAWAVGEMGDLERSIELLDEAERMAVDESEVIRIAADGAFVRLAADRVDAGVERLQSLSERLERMDRPPPELVYSVMKALGTGLSMLGQSAASVDADQRAADAARSAFGKESSRYAVALANLGNSRMQLGQFSAARGDLQAAVALYDRIYGNGGAIQRGAARNNLARLSTRLGRFDRGAELMAHGSSEWAETQGRAPERWPQYHLNIGWVLLRARRWHDAMERLGRAEALFEQEKSTSSQYARSVFLQGLALCRRGRVEDGRAKLEHGDSVVGSGGFQSVAWQAERLEAMAACRLAQGEFGGGLQVIEQAGELIEPGWVLQRVELGLMAARARQALSGRDAADAERQALKVYLDDIAVVADHPAREWIRRSGDIDASKD